MKKILLTAVVLSILVLSVSPVLAGGRKPAPRHSPAPKSMHRPPVTTHRGSSYHGKPVPAAKHHAVPKHTPAAKYHSTPKYAPSAKYTPAGKSKTAPKYTPVSKHSPAKKFTPAGKHTASKVAHHGMKFSHGYYFKKSNPPRWTKTSYSNRWRSWFYFVPAAGTWYYYHAGSAIYYPMDYATVLAPTVVGRNEGPRTEGAQTEEETETERTTQTEQTEDPPVEEEN
jgi:hypothetical protein